MASRTRQPREREGEESIEKKRKREDRREKQRRRRKGEGGGRGKGEGGDMRESVRPVQRWSALSYRAGDYRRCSVRRIHRLWCQQGQRVTVNCMETSR